MTTKPEVYDVAVMGGGPAGATAAIQAAREGARTLLVEKQAQLGGTTTTAAVNAIATFFAHGRQVIAGIGWEIACASYAALRLPAPTGEHFGKSNGVTTTVVDRAVYAAVLDETVLNSGVDLRLHTMLGALTHTGKDWEATLCGKEGLYTVRARVVLDCTADANAAAIAGLDVDRLQERQPGTLVFRLQGYDANALDYDVIQKAADGLIATGTLKASDFGWHHGSVRQVLAHYGGNCIHILAANADDSIGRTAMEVEGRRVLLRLLRFFRTQPGLEACSFLWHAAECGVRETAVIRGRTTITGEAYYSGYCWPDAVCFSFYPIDMHLEHGVDYRDLARGVVPTIPYGAMVPLRGTNVLAAGRCICGDRVGSSAYRVQASCMAMGQAAGAAAALAVRSGKPVADVPVETIRELLARHGAIVPEPVVA
jgi:hypothetical protein